MNLYIKQITNKLPLNNSLPKPIIHFNYIFFLNLRYTIRFSYKLNKFQKLCLDSEIMNYSIITNIIDKFNTSNTMYLFFLYRYKVV